MALPPDLLQTFKTFRKPAQRKICRKHPELQPTELAAESLKATIAASTPYERHARGAQHVQCAASVVQHQFQKRISSA